jgi:hypothetical protein
MAQTPHPKILCVSIAGSESAIRAFLARYPMQAEYYKREGENIVLEAFLPESAVNEIKDKDLKVHVLFDASARGQERQKEVGTGNRFEGEQRIPKGLGVKTREGPR